MANENEYQDQGPQSPFDMALHGASAIAKFGFSFSALKMLRDAPTEGYYVPWTRTPRGPGGGTIARFGTRQGLWGSKGLFHIPVSKRAVKMYRSAAWGGLRDRGARNLIETSFTRRIGASAAKRVAAGAAMSVVTGNVAALAITAAELVIGSELIGGAARAIYGGLNEVVGKYRGLELGGYFPETQASYTSRQRSLQAITSSQLQARSAIGNEAMLFHR